MGAHTKHRPGESGYDETQPTDRPRATHDAPDPDAAGGERAQVASAQHPKAPGPGEPASEPPKPEEDEPTPPGEHKREPIHDPDPADTKLHVRQASR